MTILLVEDNEWNRDMLTRRLTLKGYHVVCAVDGEEAVRMTAAETPDVVLMDIGLPVIDGWEAIRRIKASPDIREIPIIAVTAHSLPEDREAALAAGCCDFVSKPIDFAYLLGAIRRHQDAGPGDAPSV